MCCPGEEFGCSTVDRYMGHRTVSKAFEKYIALTRVLHCRSPLNLRRSTEPQEPFDLYVARVVHESQVPENIPYAALYLLASISQSCNCRLPQEDESDEEHPTPSRITHVLSQVVTRTPFSQISESHWTRRHIFIGAFVVALLAYKFTLPDEEAKVMHCWQILPEVSGMSSEEIDNLSGAFDQAMSSELRAKINQMLLDKDFREMTEVICPRVLTARRRKLSKAAEQGKENGQKRRMSLKRSVSSFWKPSKKATPVVKEESDSDSESLDFKCRSLSPNSSYHAA